MVARRLAPALAALALAFVVASAYGAPKIPGNTAERGRAWAAGDSVVDYAFRPPYMFYLVEGVNGVHGEMDSVIAAWRNGGAAPKFRRIQHLTIYQEGGCSVQLMDLTFFCTDGTSANNHFLFNCQTVLDLPFAADSVRIKGDATTQDLDVFGW